MIKMNGRFAQRKELDFCNCDVVERGKKKKQPITQIG